MNFMNAYENFYINNKSFGLPEWFCTQYEPNLQIDSAMAKYSGREWWQMMKSKGHSYDSANDIYRRETMLYNLQRIDLYINTIEQYENQGWPSEYMLYRDESIYWFYQLLVKLDYKHIISEKLGRAIISNKFLAITDLSTFLSFARLGLIRDAKIVQSYAHLFFQNHTNIPYSCEYINEGLLNPTDFIDALNSYFGEPYKLYDLYGNHDEKKRRMLSVLKKYPNVYQKCAATFDSIIRVYNIERFQHYGGDKEDFKALPFADGSCMKPVKGWFSWKLE